jgi:Rrf2 family transcriptional regulator, nitric oxide-sensitive transcriptional repressor
MGPLLAMEPQHPMTIQVIATRHGLSRSHVMKVARTLEQAGIVEGLQGRGRGPRLERRPEDIRLRQLLAGGSHAN